MLNRLLRLKCYSALLHSCDVMRALHVLVRRHVTDSWPAETSRANSTVGKSLKIIHHLRRGQLQPCNGSGATPRATLRLGKHWRSLCCVSIITSFKSKSATAIIAQASGTGGKLPLGGAATETKWPPAIGSGNALHVLHVQCNLHACCNVASLRHSPTHPFVLLVSVRLRLLALECLHHLFS